MSGWSTDMANVPRGHTEPRERKTTDGTTIDQVWCPDVIWGASKCGKVMVTFWLPEQSRWCSYAHGETPLAWRPFIKDEFPYVIVDKRRTWPNGKAPAYPAELLRVAA